MVAVALDCVPLSVPVIGSSVDSAVDIEVLIAMVVETVVVGEIANVVSSVLVAGIDCVEDSMAELVDLASGDVVDEAKMADVVGAVDKVVEVGAADSRDGVGVAIVVGDVMDHIVWIIAIPYGEA